MAKILIVDDDVAVQATVQILLERAGHSVVAASDGRTMRLVHQQQPLIPIIVISGKPFPTVPDGAPDFLTMAIKLGAVRSLQKPFKPAALLATVTGCLEAAKRTSSSSSSIPAGDIASVP